MFEKHVIDEGNVRFLLSSFVELFVRIKVGYVFVALTRVQRSTLRQYREAKSSRFSPLANMSAASLLADPLVLASLNWSDIEYLLLAYDTEKRQRQFKSYRGLLNIDSMDDDAFRQQFRFEKPDLQRLRTQLRIPDRLTTQQGIHVNGDEALCIALRRLAYPNRLCDLEPLFGRHYSTLSLVSNGVMSHIETAFGCLLDDLSSLPWLNLDSLRLFSQVSN